MNRLFIVSCQFICFQTITNTILKRDLQREDNKLNTYDTFGAVVTFAVLAVEPALGHLPEVIFVQELAVVALFAEASEPMFANDGL